MPIATRPRGRPRKDAPPPPLPTPAEIREYGLKYAQAAMDRLGAAITGRKGGLRDKIEASKVLLAHTIGQPANALQLGNGAIPVLAIILPQSQQPAPPALPEPQPVDVEVSEAETLT